MIPPYPENTLAKGWRFEIDMERVERSDTWLRAKTGALRGALLLLWSCSWQQAPCGTLPNDDELIALLIDMPTATFVKHRSVLLRGWSLADDGRLYHETITARVLMMLDARKSNAVRAAESRARRAASAGSNGVVTSASRVTHAIPERDQPASSTPEPEPEEIQEPPPSLRSGLPPVKPPSPRASAEQRGSRLPDDWALPDDWRSWAEAERPDLDIGLTAARFADHWRGKAGKDARKANWQATWRNWVRGERTTAQRAPPAETFRERDQRIAAERVSAMTGGLVSARPTPRVTAEIIDMETPNAVPRLG